MAHIGPQQGSLDVLGLLLGSRSALVGVVVAIVFLAGVAALLVLVIYRDWESKKRAWAAFRRDAEENGLSDEERYLAASIARLARLKNPSLVFTVEAAFNQGVTAMADARREDRWPGKGSGNMCSTCIFLTSLREKLGFHIGPGQAKPTTINLGHIPQGAALTIVRQTSPETLLALVTGHRNNHSEFIVAPEIPVEAHTGESWVVRYPQGGILWEFDSWVTGRAEGQIVLKPTGRVRWINRRRFMRIDTRKSAYVAPFPFLRSYQTTDPPEFYEATVTEIGGPGMQLEASVQVARGDRVLVVVELQPDQVAEGIGIVRRATSVGQGVTAMAVELVGLDTAEVAELARATKMAEAIANAQRAPAGPPDLG